MYIANQYTLVTQYKQVYQKGEEIPFNRVDTVNYKLHVKSSQ